MPHPFMATVGRFWILLLVLLAYIHYSEAESAEITAARCAFKRTKAIQDLDKKRADDGIDTSTAVKTIISPGLLSSGDSDQSPLANPATFINFIKRCNRLVKIEDVLKANLPSDIREIAVSPYKLSSPCPDVKTMKYRRSDGSCNNMKNPLWGSSKTPFIRKLRPIYQRGDKPRQHGSKGTILPNPRLISTTIHTANDKPSTALVTTLYIGFAQYLTHDITNTPMARGYKGYPINCCDSKSDHTKCFNIDIPANDPFYSRYNVRCMEFSRSTVGTDLNLKNGVREQINIATSYVDSSNIYGDDATISDKLVDLDTGKLKVSMKDLPTMCRHQNAKADAMGIDVFCAGDPKLNESPQLYTTTTLFHRVHNSLVDKLAKINSQWNGLKLYEEARRITIAFTQHIAYREFLTMTVSDAVMNKYNLRPQTTGYYTGYDANLNPSIWNGFAAAAMRFGHSMLNNDHVYAHRNYDVKDSERLELKDAFFRTFTHLVRHMEFVRGTMVTPSEVCDHKIVPAMTNRLFETKPGDGLDIGALNIQRGRDHGLPPYHKWRKAFNLKAPTDWSPSSFPNHSQSVVDLFKKVYASWRDIDLFSGAVSETAVKHKTVGPLLAEFVAAQFDRLKRGDRFWYETGSEPQRFSVGQLQEIRKVTLAHLLCQHVAIDNIQVNPLLVYDATTNPRVPCSGLSKIDFTKWADKPGV